jgi:hypothetical protein
MAELPNPYGQRQVPRSQRQIVTDNSGELMGRAAVELGQGVEAVGAHAQQREDQFNYAKARSSLLQADLEARQSLENDQDYETHEQRYTEKMAKARDDAAELIRGPTDRAQFQQESNLDISRGSAAVAQNARGIEVDKAMSDLSTLLEGNRAAALKATDEPTRSAIIQNSIDAIGAARSQYGDRFTAVQATQLRQQWTRDYAEGAITMMPADQRIAALKGEPADRHMAAKAPPGLVEPGNVEAWDRKVLKNPDGSYSTTSSMSIGEDKGEVLIPTVVNGVRLSQAEAIKHYHDTGEHLGVFDTPEHADAYAQFLHEQQAAYIENGSKTKSVADFLQPDERAKMLKQAEAEDKETQLRAASQKASDGIMGKYNDQGEALAAARKITDPDVRDATTQRVNQRFAEIKQVDEEHRDAAFTAAAAQVEKTGSVDGIDVRTWQTTLTLPQRNALEARAKQLREGEEPKTDLAVYYETLQQSQSDPNAFMRRNLMIDRPSLSAGDFQSLAHLQVAMRTKDGSDEKLLAGVRTRQQVVDGTLREIGVKFGEGASPDQNMRANEFRSQVDERVIALQKQTGKEATAEDVQKIADGLIVKGSTPGHVLGIIPWSTSKRLYEVNPGDEFAVKNVNDVPAGDRTQIEAALKRAGRAVSNEAVLMLYNAKVQATR